MSLNVFLYLPYSLTFWWELLNLLVFLPRGLGMASRKPLGTVQVSQGKLFILSSAFWALWFDSLPYENNVFHAPPFNHFSGGARILLPSLLVEDCGETLSMTIADDVLTRFPSRYPDYLTLKPCGFQYGERLLTLKVWLFLPVYVSSSQAPA